MVSYAKLVSLVVLGAATSSIVTASNLQDRQLQTLPPKGSGSSSTTTTSSTTTSSSIPSITTPITTLATQTGPIRWELTTVFTQPADCTNGITQYAGDLSTLGYWLNIPYPAPGITITSCFPPVLVASATAAVDQPPYQQLVCPYKWESLDYNSTYRICCPKNFGFYVPGIVSNPDRPGLGAWCTSWAPPGTRAALMRYFTNGVLLLIDTVLGTAENWLVQATAFDGIIATNVPSTATPSSSSSSSLSLSSSNSSPTSSTIISTPKSTSVTTTTTPLTTSTPSTTPTWTGSTSFEDLPKCGQTCIENMLNKYQELGCGPLDAPCMCRAPNFNYGVRDCASAACNAADATTVIAFETSYWCPYYMASGTNSPTLAPTPTAISDLPACGQTCMNNMIGQYSTLGCASPDPACLCNKVNFGYGVRDCANGACGADVAPTVTNFASSHYCSPTPAP